MRKNILLGVAVGAVLVFGSAGGAFAGEIGGHGQDTGGPSHANSPCTFSGLEDGAEGGDAGPGNVQNWGHTKDIEGVVSTHGASSAMTPEGVWGCNGHTYSMKH